jgi:hypothetical protein
MPLHPTRIVRVTNEKELEAALGSADQATIDRLLSYAIARASNDPARRIPVELGSDNPFREARDAPRSARLR